nr:phosphopantetheine-binding protein [uncultured Rhodococcus sp.]
MSVTYKDIASVVNTHFPEFAGTIEPTTTYSDLDFDSLVLVELGVVLSRIHSVAIEEQDLVAANSFSGAAELVNRLIEERAAVVASADRR